jgi:hypothetical protein
MCDVIAKLMLLSFYAFNMNKFMIHSAFAVKIRSWGWVKTRVSFETSFDSKQPKLEQKLVLVLSETKCLFQLFCFHAKTESFNALIEPKQTEDQPEQGAYFGIFSENLWFSRFVLVCLETVCFGCLASIPKQRVSMI